MYSPLNIRSRWRLLHCLIWGAPVALLLPSVDACSSKTNVAVGPAGETGGATLSANVPASAAGAGGVVTPAPTTSSPTPVTGECASATDCQEFIAGAVPTGCAEATCEQGTCRVLAVDQDKDGQRRRDCSVPGTTKSVELGLDCNDAEASVSTLAWDGPANADQPNRCADGIDQNCNGVDGDSVLPDGTSCECTPGQTATCSEDAGGIPITWPLGQPFGICKFGVRTCFADAQANGAGRFGNCEGAIGPRQEFCNAGADDNCKNNGDADAVDKIFWSYDADGDKHSPTGSQAVLSCPETNPNQVPAECNASCQLPNQNDCCPPTAWQPTVLQANDCDDADLNTFAGATEICDGEDNDCNTTPDDNVTSVPTWYWDADEDRHIAPGAPTKEQCGNLNPGDSLTNCGPSAVATCPNKWTRFPLSQEDCDDTNAARFPGNWDGPAVERWGIKEPGWVLEGFARNSGNYSTAPAPNETPSFTQMTGLIFNDWGYAQPFNALGADYFALRYTGTVVAKATETVTFIAEADDGVRVWVDGALIIDAWRVGSVLETQGSVAFTANTEHTIRVEYFEANQFATLKLSWQAPSFARRALRVRDSTSAAGNLNQDYPASCDNVDNNCDLEPDNQIAVTQGVSLRSCASVCQPGRVDYCGGLNAQNQRGVGQCREGTTTCSAQGTWGGCQGSVAPQSRNCTSSLDNNCDGAADNVIGDSYCKCSPGAVQACPNYGYPTKDGIGICRAGTQTCGSLPGGATDFGQCVGRVDPTSEQCGPGSDKDCDKIEGNGNGCTQLLYVLSPSSSAFSSTCTPADVMMSTSSNEAGYVSVGSLRVFTAAFANSVRLTRCYCPALGRHTAVLGDAASPCDNLAYNPTTCSGGWTHEGTLGYVTGTYLNALQGYTKISRSRYGGSQFYCSGLGGCFGFANCTTPYSSTSLDNTTLN